MIIEHYSQFGEDVRVLQLFTDDYKGYFVEVGALDGIRFSTTYLLEELGWDGIVIEAHPDYFKLLQENRKCTCIGVAIGNEDKESCSFKANYRGSLSSLDDSLNWGGYGKYLGKGNEPIKGFQNGKISVPMAKLDTVLEENVPEGQEIDLITVDIEGSEKFALEAFDVTRWSPRIIIFETSVVKQIVFDYMKDTGYRWVMDTGCNSIFCRDVKDEQPLKNVIISSKRKDVPHPADI